MSFAVATSAEAIFASTAAVTLSNAEAATHGSAIVALGRRIFFDSRLSLDGRISCASCHDPEHAFAGTTARARGVYGKSGTRNAPSLRNAAFSTEQFWDGRRPTLEAQVDGPFVNRLEHGLRDHEQLLGLLRQTGSYDAEFVQVFEADAPALSMAHVRLALVQFVLSLRREDSPFDRFQSKDSTALSPAARRGFELFRGPAQCASCHLIEGDKPIFTDNRYHALRAPLGISNGKLATLVRKVATAPPDEVERLIARNADVAALGRFNVTRDARDIGAFRTPSLRNVALTAPYMHDGSVPRLEEAVDHEIYYRSAATGRPLRLSRADRADIVEFLRTLTSSSERIL